MSTVHCFVCEVLILGETCELEDPFAILLGKDGEYLGAVCSECQAELARVLFASRPLLRARLTLVQRVNVAAPPKLTLVPPFK